MAILEHCSPRSGLAVFEREDLLLEQVDVLGREQENALVKVENLGISSSTYSLHLLAPRLILGFQDGCFEEFEQLQLLVFKNVFGGCNIDFAVLVGAILIVDHVVDALVNDKLVPQPRIELRDYLVQSFECSHLLNSLCFE